MTNRTPIATNPDMALITTPATAPFKYHRIGKDDVKALEGHAKAITAEVAGVRKANVAAMLRIGKELTAARDRLANHGNGTFGRWCNQRCKISRSQANRMIRPHLAFHDCPNLEQTYDVSALYELSSKRCPPPARSKAQQLAEQGTKISRSEACKIVAQRKPRTATDQHRQAVDPPLVDASVDGARRELEGVIRKWRAIRAGRCAGSHPASTRGTTCAPGGRSRIGQRDESTGQYRRRRRDTCRWRAPACVEMKHHNAQREAPGVGGVPFHRRKTLPSLEWVHATGQLRHVMEPAYGRTGSPETHGPAGNTC